MLTTLAFFLMAMVLMLAVIADSLWRLFQRRFRRRQQHHSSIAGLDRFRSDARSGDAGE